MTRNSFQGGRKDFFQNSRTNAQADSEFFADLDYQGLCRDLGRSYRDTVLL